MLRLLIALCLALPQVSSAAPTDRRPVPMHDRGSTLAADWHHGAFMEIFVRAWKDSDGDGIGDLRGLTQTLPYLQALGIRGIWLMPITPSADHDHGYHTTDFRDVAPEYGTLADFDDLLRQAHRRGIGVVMDYVINHASAAHPFFQQALEGPGNPFHPWFVWADAKPEGWDIWGKDPWYHTASRPWAFAGDARDLPRPPADARGFYFGTFNAKVPDFDLTHADTWRYHEDSLRFWLNRGLDGVRLDAVPHMVECGATAWNDQPESRALTRRLQSLITAYRQRWAVCEATAEPLAYAQPEVCGAAFAFGYVQHYVKAARGDAASVRALVGSEPRRDARMATMVSNHDIFAGRRLWDQVGGDEARYRLAAAGYLMQPGTPFVYYGEELGQAGLHGLPGMDAGDLPIRGPMSWTAAGGFSASTPFRPVSPNAATRNAQAERADPASLWHFYRALIGLRNRHASIRRGSFEQARADGLVAQWQRRAGADHTVTLIHYGTAGTTVTVPALPPGARLRALYPAQGAPARAGADGRARLYMGPLSVRVYAVRR